MLGFLGNLSEKDIANIVYVLPQQPPSIRRRKEEMVREGKQKGECVKRDSYVLHSPPI